MGRELEEALAELTGDLVQALVDEGSREERLVRALDALQRLAMSGQGAMIAERLDEIVTERRVDRKLGEDLALLRAATMQMALGGRGSGGDRGSGGTKCGAGDEGGAGAEGAWEEK